MARKGDRMRLGIDLGGTKIHGVVVDGDGLVVARARSATKPGKGYQGVLERIAETAKEAAAGAGLRWKQVEAVGLAVPGPVDVRKGVMLMAPNLGWEPSPVARDLGALLGREVVLGNDASLGALGEAEHGAARGAASAFAAFVGTGLGGGLVIKGKVVNGARGFAGEIGHMPAPFGAGPCGCGRTGCLETTASKAGIARLLREAAARGEPCAVDLSQPLRSSALRRALDGGCPSALRAVERAAEALAWGLTQVGHVADPAVFVLGGGVCEALGRPFLERVRSAMAAGSRLYASAAPELLMAGLGDDAVAVGAAVAAGRA